MGLKFWLVRSVKVFCAVAIILFGVQMLKSHPVQDALYFALLWAFVATSVFTGSRVYLSRKGVACALCNDLPDPESDPA